MFPAVFVDRDGVLIEDRPEYVREWSQVAILPNVLDALSNLQHHSYKIIVVTHQSAVGRGLISFPKAQELNNQLVETLRENGRWIDAVYMCPHKPDDPCTCRKPQPGLLLQAARELSLDLSFLDDRV